MNDFLATRRQGIGGSDIAAIIGVSQFKTALDVYLSKTTDQPEQQGEHLYWGHALENPIIDRFVRDTGANVIRQPEMRHHPQHQWAIANADALIVDGAGNPQAILEIKTASAYKTKDWGSDGDNVPIEYIAQVQWYMEIFNVDCAHIAVLIGGRDYRQYTIERDRELAAEKALKEQISQHEELLKIKIGQHAIMQHNGEKLFSWKTQSSNRFDSKAFQAAHPDLYQQFIKTTQTRVFRA